MFLEHQHKHNIKAHSASTKMNFVWRSYFHSHTKHWSFDKSDSRPQSRSRELWVARDTTQVATTQQNTTEQNRTKPNHCISANIATWQVTALQICNTPSPHLPTTISTVFFEKLQKSKSILTLQSRHIRQWSLAYHYTTHKHVAEITQGTYITYSMGQNTKVYVQRQDENTP